PPTHLPSFPTRRSSDLSSAADEVSPARTVGPTSSRRARANSSRATIAASEAPSGSEETTSEGASTSTASADPAGSPEKDTIPPRSEEHTSELQSRFDLV